MERRCKLSLGIEWLALSLSQRIVVRSVESTGGSGYGMGTTVDEPSLDLGSLLSAIPVSSYSRYAAMYGLAGSLYLSTPPDADSGEYEQQCLGSSSRQQGLRAQGNWICPTL